MKLSLDQVKKVATLANLPLSGEEEQLFSTQLSAILDYIDQLNSVDTEGIEPIYNVAMNTNNTRRDEVSTSVTRRGASLTQEEALQNASLKHDGFFVTKGVFNDE